MNRKKDLYVAVFMGIFFALPLQAAEEKETSKEIPPKVSSEIGSRFRCERNRGATLAVLKEKLVTNCNLDKPFSMSGTDTLLDGAYTYCCHIK